MADHTARFQLSRYVVAENLARAGRTAEAIDICWDLRVDPSLTLWNRALVNLLLATEVDVERHPDAAKFAIEAIDLSRELTRRAKDPFDKYELVRIRRHAQRALDVINENLEIVRANRRAEARAEKEATVVTGLDSMHLDEPEKNTRIREVTPELQPGDKMDTDEPGVEKAEVPWRLEGAYTPASSRNPPTTRSTRAPKKRSTAPAMKKSDLRKMVAALATPPLSSDPIANPADDNGR